MPVNLAKLTEELVAAGLPVRGLSGDPPEISWEAPPTGAQTSAAASIVAVHDPALTRAQRLAARGFSLREAAMLKVAQKGALAPQWAKDELSRCEGIVDGA